MTEAGSPEEQFKQLIADTFDERLEAFREKNKPPVKKTNPPTGGGFVDWLNGLFEPSDTTDGN